MKKLVTFAALLVLPLVSTLSCSSADEPVDPRLTVDEVGQTLTKCQSPGGNGWNDFCDDPACPCVSGEGDCDVNSQCSGGTICAADNGPNFGMTPGVDVCVIPSCANGVQDGTETGIDCGNAECGTICPTCPLEPNGGANHCTSTCPCPAKEGDCDIQADCNAGLVCKPAVGQQCGFSSNVDVCLATHCNNSTQDADETGVDCGGADCCACSVCPPNGQANTCSYTCRCASGWGDCDSSAECQTGLVCGNKNGPQFGMHSSFDVCVPSHCTNGAQDTAQGETGVDCGGPCGTCGFGSSPATSCQAGINICGPSGTETCCAATKMPQVSFFRNYDGVLFTDATNKQALNASHFLDKFEVNVARFRAFVNAFDAWRGAGNPAVGAGAHPLIANSGWNSAWTLAADAATLSTKLACDPTFATWTATPGGNEARPINCVTWYEAFAFCMWDAGRLPTESEWNAFASHANQQRVYPWSNPASSTSIDSTRASYACTGDGNPATCAVTDLIPVGSKPAGNALLGNADMSGNVWEWTLDYWQSTLPFPCSNCANVSNASQWRVVRGGSFLSTQTIHLAGAMRERGGVVGEGTRGNNIGFRCARQ